MSDEAPTHKQCTKCGETKLIEDFYKRSDTRTGHESACKECKNRRFRERYAMNPEPILKRQQAHRIANPGYLRAYRIANATTLSKKGQIYYAANFKKISQQRRIYREANLEKFRQQDHAYYLKNRDRCIQRASVYGYAYRAANAKKIQKYMRTHYEANTKQILERNRAWRIANPDTCKALAQNRRARVKGNGGTFTAAELKAMRIEYAGVCFYCKGQHEPNELTIDHVIPIRQGGRHEAANIVLACGICNSSKGNRTPEQWTDRWYERKSTSKRKKA